MANEKRLIDSNKAQAVLVNMAEHLLEAGNPEMAGAVGYAAEVIRKQKTVDAVEVVRCKDCQKRYNPKECPMCVRVYGEQHDVTNDDGYCDYGERRTDA